MEATNKSIVATFREQQALQEQAAQQGLYGLAIVANHQAITARLERGAERILRLFHEGKVQEAVDLMATPQWGEPAPELPEAEQG